MFLLESYIQISSGKRLIVSLRRLTLLWRWRAQMFLTRYHSFGFWGCWGCCIVILVYLAFIVHQLLPSCDIFEKLVLIDLNWLIQLTSTDQSFKPNVENNLWRVPKVGVSIYKVVGLLIAFPKSKRTPNEAKTNFSRSKLNRFSESNRKRKKKIKEIIYAMHVYVALIIQ